MTDSPSIAQLGRYRLERRIAQGGMGEVWLAHHQGAAGWEKKVALKTILPHLAEQEGFIERFLDEARIATTLTHGNIVPVFEFGHDQETYFLAMEYVDGWDLRTLLRRIRAQHDTVPEDLALYIVAEICRGLDYAHQRHDADGNPSPIIHRDVSPSNILVSKDGDVRLVDFGIASARERIGTTLTGELRGKIAYMSPEQAAGRAVDPRSDLFSLAIVLYEILAGHRPFEGDTDMEVLHRVQRADYTPLKTHRKDLNEATYALIDTALQLDPEDRFSDASAMQMQVLDILYHKTGPVSARQLAAFCSTYDRKTYDSGIRLGQSFDDLLQAQLLALEEPSTPSNGSDGTPTPPLRLKERTRTVTTTPAVDVPRVQTTTTPHLEPAHASPDDSTAVRRFRRRRRTLIAAIFFVLLLILIASILAFRLGARSGSTAPVIRVFTEPAGALIYFDGVSYGRSTLVARPAPGEWLIRAELEGHDSQERSILFEGDSDLDVRMRLPALPALDNEDIDVLPPESAHIEEEITESDQKDTPEKSAETDDADDTADDALSDKESAAPTPSYARVAVRGLPSRATVWVNGARQSDASSVRVPIGERVRIEASAPGYARKSVYWTAESSHETLPLSLDALPTGTLTIRFIGDVLIGETFVNDTSYGVNNDAPRTRVELPAGEHRVRVQNKALDLSYTRTIEVKEGQDTTVTVDWSPE